MARNRLAAAVGLALSIAGPAAAQSRCDIPPGWEQAGDAGIVVAFKASPAIATGQFFGVDFRVCGAQPGDGVPRVDATMPRHGHGMNYRPKVVRTAPGAYRAEGLLFHMAGLWRLSFEVPGAEGVTRVTSDLDVRR